MLVVQVRIERLKDVSQIGLVLVFPIEGVWISTYTCIIYHVATPQSELVTLVVCSSVQDQLKTLSQWKDKIPQILIYSQLCKKSVNPRRVKQDLLSLIPHKWGD